MRAWRLVALSVCVACGGTTATGVPAQPLPRDGATYWPGAEWRTARPGQMGLDSARLAALVGRIRGGAIPGLSALVIARHGYVVTEQYFNGSHRGDVHTMQSVSKSVTALVAGIAADAGALAPRARIFDLLPRYADLAAADARKGAVAVGDLLAMRAGIDFHESPYEGSPLQRLNESRGDWVRIALEPPMNAAPGERWQYNSGGVIVLAAAVRAGVGVPFEGYARERLFARLGITTEQWARSPFDGLPHTGGGLSLRAVDLARIGYLVLRDGRWDGAPVVSSAWLAEMLRPRTLRARTFGGYPADYAYLWWLLPLDPARPTSDRDNVVYAGSGNLNQWLFVVPAHDLVVAVTGMSNAAFAAPVAFLYQDIIPAIRE